MVDLSIVMYINVYQRVYHAVPGFPNTLAAWFLVGTILKMAHIGRWLDLLQAFFFSLFV